MVCHTRPLTRLNYTLKSVVKSKKQHQYLSKTNSTIQIGSHPHIIRHNEGLCHRRLLRACGARDDVEDNNLVSGIAQCANRSHTTLQFTVHNEPAAPRVPIIASFVRISTNHRTQSVTTNISSHRQRRH